MMQCYIIVIIPKHRSIYHCMLEGARKQGQGIPFLRHHLRSSYEEPQRE
ncbi:Uncharacterised protein [Chlamydia trachomatis]|nr:Uncharacterised protein [Chlamydia trachomatis]